MGLWATALLFSACLGLVMSDLEQDIYYSLFYMLDGISSGVFLWAGVIGFRLSAHPLNEAAYKKLGVRIYLIIASFFIVILVAVVMNLSIAMLIGLVLSIISLIRLRVLKRSYARSLLLLAAAVCFYMTSAAQQGGHKSSASLVQMKNALVIRKDTLVAYCTQLSQGVDELEAKMEKIRYLRNHINPSLNPDKKQQADSLDKRLTSLARFCNQMRDRFNESLGVLDSITGLIYELDKKIATSKNKKN